MRAVKARLTARLAAATAILVLFAVPAGARAATYPPGGGTFTGGAEGWSAAEAKCELLGTTELGALCKGEGTYDASQGHPAGSLAARTTATVNAAGLFKSTVLLQSPEFTVSQGGPGTLSFERQFEAATLASVGPKANYQVTLVDRTSGAEAAVSNGTLGTESSDFSRQAGTVTVTSGDAYVIRITVGIESTVKAALVGASGAVHFDNVSLTAGPAGGGSGNGGAGNGAGGGNGNAGGEGRSSAGGLSAAQMQSLIAASLGGSATMKGNRITVRAKCPKKLGAACRTTVQGMLKKGKPATAPRTAKIAKGKARRLVLKVKPRAKAKLMKRKRLLFKVTTKVGKSKATAYKTLKLVHR
jgi:hypothetical protein